MEDYSFAPEKNQKGSLMESKFTTTVRNTPEDTETSIHFPWDLKHGGFCLKKFTLPENLTETISEREIRSLVTSFNDQIMLSRKGLLMSRYITYFITVLLTALTTLFILLEVFELSEEKKRGKEESNFLFVFYVLVAVLLMFLGIIHVLY